MKDEECTRTIECSDIDPTKRKPGNRRRSSWRFWIILFAVMAAVSMIGFHPVQGDSMEPAFHDGERPVSVCSLLTGVHRGDAVVVRMLPSDSVPDVEFERPCYILKRVAAVPGDTIVFNLDGNIYVNGEMYSYGHGEWYVYEAGYPGCTWQSDGSLSITVPEGEFYLLGDNRGGSADSRYFGTVPGSTIKQVVVYPRS